MMVTKLWMPLCALLLIHVGSAEHNGDHAAASSTPAEVAPRTTAAESITGSSLTHTGSAAVEPAPNATKSSLNGRLINATVKWDVPSVPPQPTTDNDSVTVAASVASFADKMGNLTDEPTSEPTSPPSESHTPTSHVPPTAHRAHTATVDTPSTTSHPSTALHPHSITPSIHKTHTSTSLTPNTSPKAGPESVTLTTGTQSSSTSSTRSSHEPPKHTSAQSTSQPHTLLETSSEARPMTTTTTTTTNLPSSLPTQARAHVDTPSQLNVKGDTTMVHESPTLDPLLAGLVSAFVITAVILTLLLFLKLRRRNNRPEFRRLQDLPMDDMMEDTPLSMFSY